MQKKILFSTLLLLIFGATILIRPSFAVDTLSPDDFGQGSFSKTVDFFDFARAYAAASGKSVPPSSWHAYLYQNYVNESGFQLFYSGLINITAGEGALTIPVQSFLEHFKTPEGKDVLMSSSFIMLLAFNDTATSLIDGSPDMNDNLYASFSLGFDLSNITGTSKPALSGKTELIPLTHPNAKTWEWGMRYINLTAIWWRMFINPLSPRYEALPIAITTYEELTFTYKLVLDPATNTATVTSNYVIGRMTNLWLIWWLFLTPVVAHFNATGTYWPNGAKISDQTVYQFLDQQHIKMSIVLFQNSLALDQVTESTFNNQDVTDAEVDVSNGAISTQAGNEEIFNADFGVKSDYKLYNFTADNTEVPGLHAVARTVPRLGFARNPLFSIHVALLKYVPLIVKHIDPQLYQKAKDHILNMSYADYFCVISYPKYSGFKVEHDPTYTAYASLEPLPAETPKTFGLLLVGGIAAAVIIGAVLVTRRRKPKTQALETSTLPEPSTPTITTTT